jgi:undecaprenyldiphospho-muramoylpentapeptide beta-N-acetylglucosaminyltransferase
VRLLICAGGTGGGVYPALAVHNALKALRPEVETLWVGGEGGMEARLVERASIPFKTIPAAGVHGVDLRKLPGNLAALSRGVFASRDILDEFKPDVLFFTGGYVAVPMALAGRKTPSLLYVPDIEPGMALKALAYFAKRIILTAEESKQYFPRTINALVTGYPVRPDLLNWKKPVACKRLGIKTDLPVVLVFGGSKGARSINMALLEHLTALLERVEIIHISGELDWPLVEEKRETLSKEQAKRYHAYPYLHEDMGAALSAANLAVSRAGASVLGEYPLFGIPAILVPYPHAWRYQKVNADTLAKRGAALMIEDAKLKSGLYLTVEKLLESPEKLEAMRVAMLTLRTPEAAGKIAAQLCELAGVVYDQP